MNLPNFVPEAHSTGFQLEPAEQNPSFCIWELTLQSSVGAVPVIYHKVFQ